MSLDFLEVHAEKSLPALDIPGDDQTPSSTASSEPPSPNPLSDSIHSQHESTSQSHTPESSTSTHTTSSTSSLPAPPLSVKFAPLPELAPRKRRSTAPLGMAARGALARRRRGNQVDSPPDVSPANITYLSPEEFEVERLKQEEMAARYAQYQASAAALAAREYQAEQYEEEQETEKSRMANDAEAVSLGKIVKVARMGFWRRGVNKDVKSVANIPAIPNDSEKTKPVKEGSIRRRKSDVGRSSTSSLSPSTPVPPVPGLPLRPILTSMPSHVRENTGPQEEGAAWEDEIRDGIPLNLSQTETFVEGRTRTASSVKTAESKVDELAKTLITKMEGKPTILLRASHSSASLNRGKLMANGKS